MAYVCCMCEVDLDEPLWVTSGADTTTEYAICEECLSRIQEEEALRKFNLIFNVVYFSVVGGLIAGLACWMYQIRPQYVRRDLARVELNFKASYTDIKGYFSPPPFDLDVELGMVEAIGQRFRYYASRYSAAYGVRDVVPNFVLHKLDIQFGIPDLSRETKRYAAAHCEWDRYHRGIKIVINPMQWVRLTDASQESLVFHELGHCLLQREHRDDKVTIDGRNVAASVMHSSMFSDGDYLVNHEYYMRELFGGITEVIYNGN